MENNKNLISRLIRNISKEIITPICLGALVLGLNYQIDSYNRNLSIDSTNNPFTATHVSSIYKSGEVSSKYKIKWNQEKCSTNKSLYVERKSLDNLCKTKPQELTIITKTYGKGIVNKKYNFY